MGASFSRSRAIACWSQAYLEISSYLTPADLVSLSRTCRLFFVDLRDDAVWRRSLEDSASVPPCPADRRYRTWAVLYCTIQCSICGTETPNPIYTPLKARLCTFCERNELVPSPWQNPGGYTTWDNGAHKFEQVVLRRDLERWISGGGKVESHGASPAIMYPAHPTAMNWLHPKVQQMRVGADPNSPPNEPAPVTFFAQQVSDRWLNNDFQQLMLASRRVAGGAEAQGTLGTEQANHNNRASSPLATARRARQKRRKAGPLVERPRRL